MADEILRSKHAFGEFANLDKAIADGKIDAYDILFLDGKTEPKIGWVDKDGNVVILDGWDAAEKNAKDYADGLNTAMTGKVDAIDGRLQTAEGAVATKAEQEALTAAVKRIAKNEGDIAANAAAIAKFQPIAITDIEALFA